MSLQTCAQDQYFTDGSIIFSKQTNYLVQSILGEGSFGKVVKCVRLKDKKTVAVKIIKKEGHYYARVKKEILALLKLKGLDADKCNIVQIHSAFYDRGNFCFVFEHLDKSLSDFIEANGFRPLPLKGIRVIVQQLAVALDSLCSVGLTHCDIKLDNIMLVDHEKQPFRVKLIDFGIASVASSIPQGSVIQALSYRSPEVLLGLPVTEAVDMWSLGCVVGKLYLGDRLFNGKNEYDMMRCIVELLGQPPNRMLDAGQKTQHYFKRGFCAWNRSWKLRNDTNYCKRAGQKHLDSLDDILNAFPTKGSEGHELILFVNMLKKMLDLDPTTRITPGQLLQHGFLSNAQAASPAKEPGSTARGEKGQTSHGQSSNPKWSPRVQLKTAEKKRKHESVDEDATCHNSKRAKNLVQGATAERSRTHRSCPDIAS